MHQTTRLLPFSLLIFLSISAHASTSLPAFFSSNMVLQQKEEVLIWGDDSPETALEVSASWGQTVTTKSNNKGKWKIGIKTPVAGGPYTLTIKGSETIVLEDVLVGEVWLASGQSNMEMSFNGFAGMDYYNNPINDSNEAILNSKNNQIRLFNTARAASLQA